MSRDSILDLAAELAKLAPHDEAEDDERESVARIKTAGELIAGVVAACNELLTSDALLDSLASAVRDRVSVHLSAYQADGSLDSLDAAIAGLDQVWIALAPIRPLTDVDALRAVGVEVGRLRQQVGQHMRRVNEEADAVFAQLMRLKDGIDEIKTQEVANVKLQLESTEAGARAALDELRGTVSQEQARISAFIDTSGARFEQAQVERVTAFETDQKQRTSDYLEQVDEAHKKVEASIAEIARSANTSVAKLLWESQTHVGNIEKLDEKARDLYKAVTTILLAGSHGEQAERERTAADKLRIGAVLLGLGAALVAAFAAINVVVETPLDTQHAVLKLGLTGSLVALAGYVAEQSRMHRRREERWRELQLQLSAIGPFLAQDYFDDEMRRKILIQLGRQTFVGSAAEADPTGEPSAAPI